MNGHDLLFAMPIACNKMQLTIFKTGINAFKNVGNKTNGGPSRSASLWLLQRCQFYLRTWRQNDQKSLNIYSFF